MLNSIRNAASHWIARVFFTILLLCFVFLWGVPQLYTTHKEDLISSGKSTITIDSYRLALFDQALRIASASQLGRMFSQDEIQQYRIPAFVFDQLRQDVLLDEQAYRMKIGLSKDMLAHIISADNVFQNDGVFDERLFFNYLKQSNVNQNNLLDFYAQKGKRNQLVAASLDGMKLPDILHKALFLHKEEKRVADYFIISVNKDKKIIDPDPETLQKWFDARKDHFRSPEYRTVSLLSMSPKEVVKQENISIDEIRDYYTQNASRFTTPEKRIIEELRFSTREAADEAAQKIIKGLSFENLVKAEKKTLKEITKGPLGKNEFPDYLASEIFELKQGQISPVINSLQGPLIIRVIRIIPSGPVSFEKVKEEILQTLIQNRATTVIRNQYAAVEDSRFEGLSFEELSNQYNLPLRKITLDRTGKTIEGTVVADLPQKETLLKAIYQSTENAELDPIPLHGGGYVWYQVDQIIPSRSRPLAEVKQDAIAQWKHEEAQRILDEKANNILKQLTEGKKFDALADQLGVKKQTTQALRRQDSLDLFGKEGIKALFSGPKGHYGAVKSTTEESRIIYKVITLTVPENVEDLTISPDIRASMDMMIREDLKLGMLQFANSEHPVKINGQNYNRIFNIAQ
ncbi:peptidyl-prolyl cis-trans isomerase [Bartonella ancashensis]|nr:peptidyl-prolyl cis-trans isomerase [Bartonella ancashensis]